MYPRQEGGNFDYDYYLKTHIPLVQDLVGDALKEVRIYKGNPGPDGSPEAFVTFASLFFDSVEAFGEAFGPNAEKIMGDIPNFTNIEPVVQIDERLL
jgi:uncharacterized protein (TIGR02118 family)